MKMNVYGKAEIERYAIYHEAYVHELRPNGLSEEQIKAALVKYGYEPLSDLELRYLTDEELPSGSVYIRRPNI